MTTYYFSNKGSDNNSGTASGQAWASLDKLDSIKLKAGDNILLERGSKFDETLNLTKFTASADHPVTVSSYGTGYAPILASADGNGIKGLKADYVVIENIEIANTGRAGIAGNGSDNWVIRNVTMDNAGGFKNNNAGVNWYNGSNMLIEKSTFTDTHGDGIFMRDVYNIAVKDNIFYGVHGGAADNVQIEGNNAIVTGNLMVSGLDPHVMKGNFVFQGTGLYAADNYLKGGGFGIGLSASNVVVENNTITDHKVYTWSMGIGFSDEKIGDVSQNLVVKNNDISGNPYGISFFGGFEKVHSSGVMDVKNLDISDNTFRDWTTTAVKFTDVNVEGDLKDNVYGQQYVAPVSNKYAKSDLTDLHISGNATVGDAQLSSSGSLIQITASAQLYNGAPVMLVYKNDELILKQEITAQKGLNEKETISFKLDDFHSTDKLSIKFANDSHGADGDRNMYVTSIYVDGEKINLADGDRHHEGIGKGGSSINFNKNGDVVFDATDLHLSAPAKASTPLNIGDILDQSEYLHLHPGIGSSVKSDTSAPASAFDAMGSVLDQLHHVLNTSF